jgi:DNA-binding response OmpR family regulator
MREQDDQTPVLVLTGFNDLDRRVRGLGAGADDYLGKPFSNRELVARVGALLRRSQPGAGAKRLVLGETTVDLTARTAMNRSGGKVALTKKEFAILELLARSEGKPVGRDAILDAVWGYSGTAHTRTLDTHIWRLRRKLGDNGDDPRWIVGVPGVGYALRRDPPADL